MFSRTGRLPVCLFLNLFMLQQFFKVCEQRLNFPEGISLVYVKSKVTSLLIIMFLVHQLSLSILVSSKD